MPDIKRLQGAWSIVSLEMDGQSLPTGGAGIHVKGNAFTTMAMGSEYSGRLQVDESVFPKMFDLHFDAGPEAGNTSYGIYELDDDTWKICMTLRGGTRPGKFATQPGSGLALEILKRAAKGKSSAKQKDAGASEGLSGEPAPELAGEWSMVSAIMSGKPLDAHYVKMGKRIAGPGDVQVKIGPQTVLKADYAVDRSTSPAQMNYRLSDGRVQAGIWELSGAQLRTCFASPGQPRPREFASTEGDGRTFSVWTRSVK